MKLKDIVAASNVIDRFALKEDMGVHLAYMMSKFIVSTKEDVAFYQKKLDELLLKYQVTQDANGIKTEGDYEEFSNALKELQETDVIDPGIRFSLSELSNELKMSPQQIYPLLNFIEEDK